MISGVTFDSSSHRRLAQGSDNWPATWSDDDNQYALWGDGGGFGGTNSDGRSSFRRRPHHAAITTTTKASIASAARTANVLEYRGKAHGAPLSVGGVLYAWVAPDLDAHAYGSFALYRSGDKGCTWSKLDVEFVLANEGVSTAASYSSAKTIARLAMPTSTASPWWRRRSGRCAIVQRPGKVMLLRVPALAVQDRGAYEFFAGLDSTGQPKWSSDAPKKVADLRGSRRRGSVCTDQLRAGSGSPGVHESARRWRRQSAGIKSLLTMAEAPDPWGPWTVFYRDLFVPQIDQNGVSVELRAQVVRNGGREFTLMFSGIGVNDSWNTVDGGHSRPRRDRSADRDTLRLGQALGSRSTVTMNRKLGRDGPQLFPIGLGCMGMSEFYGERAGRDDASRSGRSITRSSSA